MKRVLLFLTLLFCTLYSFPQSSYLYIKDQEVSFSGKIVDYNKEYKTGKLTYFDAVTRIVEDKIFQIDTSGSFNFTVTIAHPLLNNNFLEVGDNYHAIVLLEPGNHYELTLNGTVLSLNGKSGEKCRMASGFYDALYDEFSEKLNMADTLYKAGLSINEFTDFQKQLESEKRSFLEEYCKKNSLPGEIKSIIASEIKFKAAHALILYRFDYSGGFRKLREMPEGFFTRLFKEYSIINEHDIQSRSCIDYISNIVSFLSGEWDSGNDSVNLHILFSNSNLLGNGLTKDLVISQAISRSYLSNYRVPDNELWASVDSKIDNQSVFNYLRNYSDQKNYALKNIQVPPDSNVASGIEGIKTKYIDKYRGKVIYIDFYATWCGPCRQEIPYAKQLYKEFENANVVFLNLCAQSKQEDWLNLLKKHGIEGENYLLSKEEFNLLSGLYKVNAFPTYVIIDKMGNVVDYDAPRPSSKKMINELIMSLNKQ